MVALTEFARLGRNERNTRRPPRGAIDGLGSSLDAAGLSPGRPDGEQFMEERMHSEHAHVFVPTNALRQGTPSNPHIDHRAGRATTSMPNRPLSHRGSWRVPEDTTAADWCEGLIGLATGCETEHRPHMRRIGGLTTRTANLWLDGCVSAI